MGVHHIHTVSDHPTLDLASLIDVDEDRAEPLAETYGADRVLTDYETALDADAAIDDAFELVGTAGHATVDTPGTTLTVHADRFDRPDTRHWPVVNGRMAGAVRRQIDRFVAAIESDEELLATVEDGAHAQAIAAATKAAAESGTVNAVDWP